MNASVQWQPVCKSSDLYPGIGVCAFLGQRQIALFRLEERVYAIDNHDPFSDANVISRGIIGDLKGRDVVASPIYKNHFDLDTGECLEDSSIVIPTYAVRTNGEIVEIAC